MVTFEQEVKSRNTYLYPYSRINCPLTEGDLRFKGDFPWTKMSGDQRLNRLGNLGHVPRFVGFRLTHRPTDPQRKNRRTRSDLLKRKNGMALES